MSDSEEELDKETLGRKVGENKMLPFLLCFLNHQAIEDLSPEKLKEYKEIFSFFDRDGGGSIGADELEQVMRTFGWDPKVEELKAKKIIADFAGHG